MLFLTSASTSANGGGSSMILMLVLMFAIFYFLIIRPENKKKKKTDEMRNSLSVGDDSGKEVVHFHHRKDGSCRSRGESGEEQEEVSSSTRHDIEFNSPFVNKMVISY